MTTPSWPSPILQQGQIWSLLFLYWKDVQETIEAPEVKVGTYSQINEYMTIYDNPRSRSFIDLCPRSLRLNIFNQFSFPKKKTLGHLKPNFTWCLHGMLGWKPGHMNKIASRPIYGKKLKKSPSSEPRHRWSWNLVYSIEYSSTTKFVKMMTLGWPWPFLWHGQICFLTHGWKFIQQYSHIFPSSFQFSISYALRWSIQDHWSSGFKGP